VFLWVVFGVSGGIRGFSSVLLSVLGVLGGIWTFGGF
jgi:hypothetical protein